MFLSVNYLTLHLAKRFIVIFRCVSSSDAIPIAVQMIPAQDLVANCDKSTITDESEIKNHFDAMETDIKELLKNRRRVSYTIEFGFVTLANLMAEKQIAEHFRWGDDRYPQLNGFFKDCKHNVDVHDSIRRELEENKNQRNKIDYL